MLKEKIKEFFSGDILEDNKTLTAYSHDASLFTVKPKLVVFPKTRNDLKNLIKYIGDNKKNDPSLSLTVRAAGSCMSGGSLNESIIADVTKYLNKIGDINEDGTLVEPGVFYRDFEVETLKKNLILPCYTASKNLNALGGMIGNNSAGEKTLRYGKMEQFVLESKVIFSDGNEYLVKPLNQEELNQKINQGDFEGNIYKRIKELLDKNIETIKGAEPKVSKNSAGYYLWNIRPDPVEGSEKMFDLNRLLVGSQGTLGIITEAKIKLVKVEPASKLFVIFLPDLRHLAELVNVIIKTNPESIESYDDATMKLAMRFFPEMLKTMKVKHFFKLIWSFVPEVGMMLKEGGVPKLIVLVEFAGKTEDEVNAKMKNLELNLRPFKYQMRLTHSVEESDKYWTIRRESFNLLRKHVRGSRTAPFIDDVIVRPEFMPEFLPKMREILDKNNLIYTIAGHAGNGNFHIIPLMDMRKRENIEVIKEVGDEVYDLVARFEGSITAEHNDGIIRTPYLNKMFSNEALELFKMTKEIFDPKNIFNPGKKVPLSNEAGAGSIPYMCHHMSLE
ncbi:MAG: FAD-binding oxidoreductase [bacterium]|nr:FAD-binding oxidoreductase [bacterium]